MTPRHMVIAAALLVFLAGCVQFGSSSSPEPDFYRLSFERESAQCEASFSQMVRVRRFSADQPFGQQRMVLWGRNGTVRLSRSARWVAEPGVMLAEGIRRDLSRSGPFSNVMEESQPGGASLELCGRILRFAAEPCDSGYRALFGVEVRLQQRSGGESPLLQKRYSLESGCFPAGDAAAFARAMSDLASEFSDRLREDLCRMQMEGS